jgi:DNA-binding NarL/FixJ family response regulator
VPPAPDPSRLTVLVADPSALTRAGLVAILRHDRRFRVVGDTAGDPRSLLLRHRPDLLVIDPTGGEGWPDRMSEVTRAAPATRVCIYTETVTPAGFAAALRAGARGYLTKARVDPPTLCDNLAFLGRGGRF